jgi:hypothetical protein
MKKIIVAAFCCYLFASCSLLRGKEKYGCPTNGKNVGAEKILSGDKATMKAVRKAGKFKN